MSHEADELEKPAIDNGTPEQDEPTTFELSIKREGDKAKGRANVNGEGEDLINMLASVLDDHPDLYELLARAVGLVGIKKLSTRLGIEKREGE